MFPHVGCLNMQVFGTIQAFGIEDQELQATEAFHLRHWENIRKKTRRKSGKDRKKHKNFRFVWRNFMKQHTCIRTNGVKLNTKLSFEDVQRTQSAKVVYKE